MRVIALTGQHTLSHTLSLSWGLHPSDPTLDLLQSQFIKLKKVAVDHLKVLYDHSSEETKKKDYNLLGKQTSGLRFESRASKIWSGNTNHNNSEVGKRSVKIPRSVRNLMTTQVLTLRTSLFYSWEWPYLVHQMKINLHKFTWVEYLSSLEYLYYTL